MKFTSVFFPKTYYKKSLAKETLNFSQRRKFMIAISIKQPLNYKDIIRILTEKKYIGKLS
jgi:hypothetical protein